MSYQKPLVTIELDEYLKTQEYIKILEDTNKNKYKDALSEIIHHAFREQYSGIKVGEILIKHGIKLKGMHSLADNITVE